MIKHAVSFDPVQTDQADFPAWPDQGANMPRRIQRKRTRGWRMPAGAVYVGRGSKWGNPYTVAEYGRDEALRKYREQIIEWLDDFESLRGKDLACWCSLDQPCHADILLEMANG